MGGQVTKEEKSIESSSPLTFRNPFDLNKESETQDIIKVKEVKKGKEDGAGDAEDDDDLDFDPNNYDPKTVGPILPNGDINWECPCLGGAAHGPCGTEFRQAFSCFHYSQEDPKGSDCFSQFREMHVCFSKFPQLYPTKDDDDDEEEEESKEDDPIQFDEEELKVINAEDNDKKETKKQEESTPERESKKLEDSTPEREPGKVKEKKESVRKEIRPKGNILTPPQPAVM